MAGEDRERVEDGDEAERARLVELRAYLVGRVPFWQTLGLELRAASREEAVFEAEYRDELSQNGRLHGGVVATLIDSACACAAIAQTFPDAYATTVALQVSYPRAVTAGRLRAVGRCVRSGGRVLFCEAQVWDAAGELVGTGSAQLVRLPVERREGASEA